MKAAGVPLLLALPLGACGDKAPTGQVLVSVGGTDITRRDLATEFEAEGVPDSPALRDELIDRVVDRALLARVAERRRLDRSPEYLAALRRTREALLVSLLADQLDAEIVDPTPQEVARYVAARPWAFGQRQRLDLDQILVAARPDDAATLGALGSIDAVAGALGTAGRSFTRGAAAADTAGLPQDQAKRLLAGGEGAPVIVSDGRQTRILHVARRTPMPIAPAQANAAAKAAIRHDMLQARMSGLLERERKETAIRYQQGVGPYARE